MADKVRFLIKSVLDSATLTASNTVTGLSAENARNNLIRKVWRSSSKNSTWLKFNAGSATTVNAVLVAGHTFSKNAVVKFQGHASDSWTSPTLNHRFGVATDAQGNVVPKLFHSFATAHSFQYYRLLVEDIGGPTFLDVGRIMAGRYIEPRRNLRAGFSMQTIDPSRGVNTAGRQAYYSLRSQYTELTYTVGQADEAQVNELLGIYAEVGKHTAFAIALDPDSRPHHNTFYAQFQTDVSRRHAVLRQFGVEDVTFQEKT